jgi:hypothetical protein
MAHSIGDPNHIGVHNTLASDVQTAATEMGVDVDLPPQRNLGDTGHVDDHNLIQAALDKIAAEGSAGASWAQVINAPDAVTSSYYDDKGGQWQYYEWNAAGTFDVEVSGGLLWVLAVAGGSSGWNSTFTQGRHGAVREGLWEFGPGTHTVEVGRKGTGLTTTENSDGMPSRIGDFVTGGLTRWGERSGAFAGWANGGWTNKGDQGWKSKITGDEREYATDATNSGGNVAPGQAGADGADAQPGTVIIATRIDVPTLPPVPPRLEVAPVVAAPVSISGPAVQEWLVRDKQGNRKVVYFLPGNTGAARSLALTDEGAEALAARRDVLDAIATTDVPEDFTGDPVTLLPKKLRAELRGFVEVRATAQPEAVFSVTLGAGVLPGVMVAAGGHGGGGNSTPSFYTGAGGAGGVIGQGAHVPVILPVQGTATYTVTVGSTTPNAYYQQHTLDAQSTTIAVQGQTPFTAAMGGGFGTSCNSGTAIQAGAGGSGGGAGSWPEGGMHDATFGTGANGLPGQGHQGGSGGQDGYAGGGGGYGGRPEGKQYNGGAGFDLATALNLDPNDGLTGSFLGQVSVNGWIAGGGAASGGTATAGGGAAQGGAAKDYTGSGGGGRDKSNGQGGMGGAGAVYLITDPT